MIELSPTPDYRDTVIVIGTSCRKPLEVLQPYLASLAYQELPPRTRLHPIFVADWPTKDPAEDYLRQWVSERGGEILRGVPTSGGDFADGKGLVTHQWTLNAMKRVAANKNKILQRALGLKADYVFLCDADLILDRTTLYSLLAAEKPVTTAVYWTHWIKQTSETRTSYAMPQVWLVHPYGLSGRGMDEAEFRAKLTSRELTRVWGYGACTLIKHAVLEAGISFTDVPGGLPPGPMSDGEDRHFCHRVEAAHIEAFADAWPDVFHAYDADTQVPMIPQMVARLGVNHPMGPALGDLVSLKLEALEPVPHQHGWTQVPRQHVRGRLGQVAIMPELEEAVYGMSRGDTKIIPVHMPLSHPVGYFRGRRRLIRVTLVDTKPFCAPPVLESELHISPRSRAITDTLTLLPAQLEGMAELA